MGICAHLFGVGAGQFARGGATYDAAGYQLSGPNGGTLSYDGDGDAFATYDRNAAIGLDYARNRQYASGWGRFTSADPYQASAGLGSPQSWNRFAYVSGNPINLVDVDGLKEEDPTFEVFVLARLPDVFGPFQRLIFDTRDNWDKNSRLYLTSQRRALQAQARVISGELTDCEGLSKFADQEAADTIDQELDNADFVSSFGQFVYRNDDSVKKINSYIPGAVQGVDKPTYLLLGNSPYETGFADKYIDDKPGNPDPLHSDQSHHFAAFFQLGYHLGALPADIAQEMIDGILKPPGEQNPGDVALGRFAAALGQRLRLGQISLRDVGFEIRRSLCSHPN